MIRTFMAMAAVGLVVVAHPSAQTQGTIGRGAAPAPKRPAVTAKTTSARVLVKDPDGAGISACLILSGASTGEFTTGAAGTAILPDLKDGMRVRCERKGFITLEREFTLHGATWNPIDIVLEPRATSTHSTSPRRRTHHGVGGRALGIGNRHGCDS